MLRGNEVQPARTFQHVKDALGESEAISVVFPVPPNKFVRFKILYYPTASDIIVCDHLFPYSRVSCQFKRMFRL